MIPLTRQLQDGETGAGSVSTVRRCGSVVHRPCGPWTPAVHALLRHLSGKGFGYSPCVAMLEPDHEVLQYIEGEVALRPWPPYLREDAGIAAIATMITQYHDAAADFTPPPSAVWRDPDARWQEGMVIRHGDLGPWNMVWKDGALAGIIDWDLAMPGFRMDDIAQLAWHAVPLRPPRICEDAGIEPGVMQRHRFRILCEGCGVHQRHVLDTLMDLQKAESNRTIRLASLGIEPWVSFHARGDVSSIASDAEWLRGFAGRVSELRLDEAN